MWEWSRWMWWTALFNIFLNKNIYLHGFIPDMTAWQQEMQMSFAKLYYFLSPSNTVSNWSDSWIVWFSNAIFKCHCNGLLIHHEVNTRCSGSVFRSWVEKTWPKSPKLSLHQTNLSSIQMVWAFEYSKKSTFEKNLVFGQHQSNNIKLYNIRSIWDRDIRPKQDDQRKTLPNRRVQIN